MSAGVLEAIGARVLEITDQAGDFVTLSARSFTCIFKRPFDRRNLLVQLHAVGVMSIDLGKTLKRFKGTAWDQSPIFKKVYEEEYGQFGGEPFGCLVGDYYFDHSPQDAEILGEMAKVSAAAHTPFISGVSPTVMQMDSWQELANPRDLTKITLFTRKRTCFFPHENNFNTNSISGRCGFCTTSLLYNNKWSGCKFCCRTSVRITIMG